MLGFILSKSGSIRQQSCLCWRCMVSTMWQNGCECSFVVTVSLAMEAIGDITASAEVSRVPVDGEEFDTRIQGGVLVRQFGFGEVQELKCPLRVTALAVSSPLFSLLRHYRSLLRYSANSLLITLYPNRVDRITASSPSRAVQTGRPAVFAAFS